MLSTDELSNVSDMQKMSILFRQQKFQLGKNFCDKKLFRFQRKNEIDLYPFKDQGLVPISPQRRRFLKRK